MNLLLTKPGTDSARSNVEVPAVAGYAADDDVTTRGEGNDCGWRGGPTGNVPMHHITSPVANVVTAPPYITQQQTCTLRMVPKQF